MIKTIIYKLQHGSPIYFNESYKLIQDREHSKITHDKALKIITDIRNDVKIVNDLDDFNQNQVAQCYFYGR